MLRLRTRWFGDPTPSISWNRARGADDHRPPESWPGFRVHQWESPGAPNERLAIQNGNDLGGLDLSGAGVSTPCRNQRRTKKLFRPSLAPWSL
jgi:hypothetical protein